jgi:hypothetical protein
MKRPIPEFPRPRDVATEVADLEAKLAGFAARTRELESERAAIAQDLAVAAPTTATTPRNARVAALLGEPDVVPDKPSRSRLTEIAIELADLREAAEAVERKRRVSLSKASAAICSGLAPEYRTRVRAVVEALKAAHTATLDLHDLTDALESSEVSWTGMGVAFPSLLGSPRDPEAPLARYLREMVDQGHMLAREVPKELHPK